MKMDKLEQLSEALDGHLHRLVILYNNPDLDAIAAAVSMLYLVAEMYGIEAGITLVA